MSESTATEVAQEQETSPQEVAPKKTRRQLLEREGEVAADFLENLLDIADLDGDIDLDIDGDRAAVAIVDSDEGRVPRRLVGQDGKVLEALQELTRLAVQSATGDRSRLMLDVAGHRAARRAELVDVARVAITAVQNTGDSVDLEPMSAFERKVVHDEVLAAGLVSDSSGTEPRRFVVVHPADESTDSRASEGDVEDVPETVTDVPSSASDVTVDTGEAPSASDDATEA